MPTCRRQAVADVEDLKKKIETLTSRCKVLETALRTLQAAVSDAPHPLLTEQTEGETASSSTAVDTTPPTIDSSQNTESSVSAQEEEDVLDAFGMLTSCVVPEPVLSFDRNSNTGSTRRNTILWSDFTFGGTSLECS